MNLSNKYKQDILNANEVQLDVSGFNTNLNSDDKDFQTAADTIDNTFNYWTTFAERESDLLLSSGNIGEMWMRIDSESPTVKILYNDSSSGLVIKRLSLT